MHLLIFTDLDGSLLDHADYSYEGARPALERIAREGWPLILVTSKTRSEVEPLQRRLGIDDPFVVENGAAAFFPRHIPAQELPVEMHALPSEAEPGGGCRSLVFGRPYAEIRGFMQEIGEEFGLRGFGDMDTAEVARLTDLEPEDAERARRREFTEPFLMADPERLPELERAAASRGFAITTGGRLYHLMGAAQSKGRAVRNLQRLLTAGVAGPVQSIGLGDSPNDREMLEVVDHPVVIPRPDGSVMKVSRADAVAAPEAGSRGWSAAVLRIADSLSDVGGRRRGPQR